MPNRRSEPRTQPFQATHLDVIIDGIGRQRADAVRQNQALATLNRMPLPVQPAGPATLTLNGEVLDENTIPSVRDLGNLRDNPEIPQLIQDRFLVSDQAGQVRVLPEPGEDPAIAQNFTPAMLAGVAPVGRTSATSNIAPVIRASASSLDESTPMMRAQAVSRAPNERIAMRTLSNGSTLLDPIIVNSLEDELRLQQQIKRQGEKLEADRRELELLRLPPTLKDENGEPLAKFEGDLVVIPNEGIFAKTPSGELIEINSPEQIIRNDPRDGKRKVFRLLPIKDPKTTPFIENGQFKFQPVSENEGNAFSRFFTDVRRASGPRFIENAQKIDLADVVIEGIKTGIELRNPALAPFLILINLSGELIVEPSIEGMLTVVRQRLSDAGFSDAASNKLAQESGKILSGFVQQSGSK